MGELDGKVALVTGAGRGIGRATALLLAKNGALVIACSRTQAEVDETARLIIADGGGAEALQCDIGDETAVLTLFSRIHKTHGALDILVNNAGVFSSAYIEDISVEEFRRVMRVNAEAVFLCCREAFALMKEKGGSIVTVSSLSGVAGAKKFPGFAAYCASKYAVMGVMDVLAEEGREFGIRANVVAPGAVDTAMLNDAFPDFGGPKLKPEQVAQTIAFLAGPRAVGINGAVVPLYSDLQK